MRKEPSVSEPMIDLLSDDIAQAKGSLVSALAEEDRPQANRPSCPSTSRVISMSRTVGGLSGRTRGGGAGPPKMMTLPLPDQVPLRSGIASCARAAVAAPTTANMRAQYRMR